MSRRGAVVEIRSGDVFVRSEEPLTDRSIRMFFESILGGTLEGEAWRCPTRRRPASGLVLRINTFLERRGFTVRLLGLAEEALQQDIERRRSFDRARDAGRLFRVGESDVRWPPVRDLLAKYGWKDNGRPLMPHQRQGVLHALSSVNAANFSVPGSGKTASALAVATAHLASKTIDLVLVVGPLSCFRPWEAEIHTSLGDRLTARRVRGSRQQRKEIYRSVRTNLLLLMSFATAASDKNDLVALLKSHRTMLVVDESHRVKRFRGGLWAPALIEVARYARIRMVLSGTPMPQSGRDLFSQLNILWPDGELTGTRDDFAVRVDRNLPGTIVEVQPFISRTAKHSLGLSPPQVIRHNVPLIGTQAEVYDLVQSHFRRRLQDASTWRDKLETLRRGRPIRLLQAATNPDLLNRNDPYYLVPRLDATNPTLMERLATYRAHEAPAKSLMGLDLITRFAAEHRKTVCWSNFVPNLDAFADLLRARTAIPCFQIDGRVAVADDALYDNEDNDRSGPEGETRERIIEEFLSVNGPAVLVTNPASCSESISLHRSCHTALYLDRTYDCALFLQSIDRIHRLGLPPGVTVEVHILLATLQGRGTVDQLVDSSLARKDAALRQLLEGAELQPISLSERPTEAAEGTDEDLAALLRYLLGEDD
jgi:SNF2 family DNA or RNA helicase